MSLGVTGAADTKAAEFSNFGNKLRGVFVVLSHGIAALFRDIAPQSKYILNPRFL